MFSGNRAIDTTTDSESSDVDDRRPTDDRCGRGGIREIKNMLQLLFEKVEKTIGHCQSYRTTCSLQGLCIINIIIVNVMYVFSKFTIKFLSFLIHSAVLTPKRLKLCVFSCHESKHFPCYNNYAVICT